MSDKRLLDKALKGCNGNYKKAADKIGVSRQLFQYWYKVGRIPSWRKAAFMDAVRQ
jgi:hypothetical protein